ncbi:MAG TPA: hypothetical protein VFD42_00825, partial [Chloroflexota bacterium]|nr:hypothetical protein [Chloroflexota bacterium]
MPKKKKQKVLTRQAIIYGAAVFGVLLVLVLVIQWQASSAASAASSAASKTASVTPAQAPVQGIDYPT